MILVGGLSFIIHLIINLYCSAKRTILRHLNLPQSQAYGRFMQPNRSSFLIVGLVFLSMSASATILGGAIFKTGDYNLSLIRTQVENLRLTAAAAMIDNTPRISDTPAPPAEAALNSGIAPGGETIQNEATGEKNSEVYLEKVLPGEGFWQPTMRLVKKKAGTACPSAIGKKTLCARVEYYYESLTASILVKNGVIKNNSEQRIARPGAILTLDENDDLFINGLPTENYRSN